jgi:hypothetical protein
MRLSRTVVTAALLVLALAVVAACQRDGKKSYIPGHVRGGHGMCCDYSP